MKARVLCIAAITSLILSQVALCQSPLTPGEKAKLLEIPIGARTWRPKLSLQDAMKIADNFMVSEKIDTTHFWLYRATYTLYGDSATPDKDKTPGWFFWWMNESGATGDYVEIFVSMDGHCMRLPSM